MPIAMIASLFLLGTGQSTADIRAGQALIDQSAANMRKVESLTFTLVLTQGSRSVNFKMKVLRGGYESTTTDSVVMIWTPKTYWMLSPRLKQYKKENSSPGTEGANHGETMPGFEDIAGVKPLIAVDAPIQDQIGDKPALRVQFKSSNPKEISYVLYDRKTKLPIGSETISLDSVSTFRYENLNLGAKLKPSDFDWTPPAGWKVFPY